MASPNHTRNPAPPPLLSPQAQPPNPLAPSAATPSTSNVPFTPRSSTFPDDLDSDDEFNAFDPTPLHSPGGPDYGDLPPSYDQAQQEALRDARNGVLPLDPNSFDVHRLDIRGGDADRGPDVREYRVGSEHGRNGEGNVVVVVVQGGEGCGESIAVGRAEKSSVGAGAGAGASAGTGVGGGDASGGLRGEGVGGGVEAGALLERALQFTRHEPDEDARFAPRLVRPIAVPQVGVPGSRSGGEGGSRSRGGARRGGRRERRSHHRHHVPGQWPESQSSETPRAEDAEGPAQFLRAYAKALHAHSIRPAEFTEFLDGLNALCAATNASPVDLVLAGSEPGTPASMVRDYIDVANEVFFAPRGLRVSLRSLTTLLGAIRIPEDRGERVGAVASVLDEHATPERRAQALHPWIEALESNVPGPSTQTLLLREMSERFRHQVGEAQVRSDAPSAREPARAEGGVEDSDPPHSVPDEGVQEHGAPPPWPFGASGGWSGPGPWGGGGFQNQHHYPGRGWSPFGPPGHGPFGAPGNGPFGVPGNGPFHASGRGCFGPRGRGGGGGLGQNAHRGPHGYGGNYSYATPGSWQAWGESWGKWGEDLGKKWEAWGEDFGKRAEGYGRSAERWAEGMERRAGAMAGGRPAPPYGAMGQGATRAGAGTSSSADIRGPNAMNSTAYDDLARQETGVTRGQGEDSGINPQASKTNNKQTKVSNKDDDDDDDDDTSSISSDSSVSSSDSDSSNEDKGEDYANASKNFQERVRKINESAEASSKKGKKTSEEIACERALAIEKAQNDKSALEQKIDAKRRKRELKRQWRSKKRELRREWKVKRSELRRSDGQADGFSSRGKGKARENKRELKEAKKAYREKLVQAKKEMMGVRCGLRKEGRGQRSVAEGGEGVKDNGREMVWVVVENLGS